jgi:3-dehydroquinate synthase II
MRKQVYFKAIPFDKKLVTLALESGVDGIIASKDDVEKISALGRVQVLVADEMEWIEIKEKKDEEEAVKKLLAGQKVVLQRGVEIIPVENIVAQCDQVGMEVSSLEEARTALGILEKGVQFVVVVPEGAQELKKIVKQVKLDLGKLELVPAKITAIEPIGLGHRVCVDTISILKTGQGMLVGNSSGFTFLVHAETEVNPYVAPRPFRINAGAVHSYTYLPGDKTRYLEEIRPGMEVLVVDSQGNSQSVVVGRTKTEVRPMILISAKAEQAEGSVVIQNAETIRLVGKDGQPRSVVELNVGDEILCRVDQAGRHFGMRIEEEIIEG